MEYWHEATERMGLPHYQISMTAQFGAFVTMYVLLPIKDQVCILWYEATYSIVPTTWPIFSISRAVCKLINSFLLVKNVLWCPYNEHLHFWQALKIAKSSLS